MKKLTVPSQNQCYQLWEQYHTPANVREHMQLVCDAAVCLGEKLQARGEDVSLELLEAGALLHDLVRFVGLPEVNLRFFSNPPTYEDLDFWRKLNESYPAMNHAEAVGKLLRDAEYPEALALVCERHDFNKIIDPQERPRTWEEKLVFYADKRVLHSQLVTLEERFRDGTVRYPQYVNVQGEDIKRAAIYELERELFDRIGIKPEELTSEVIEINARRAPRKES